MRVILHECLPSGAIRACDKVGKTFETPASALAWLKARDFQPIRLNGDVWAKDYHGEWQQPFRVIYV